MPPGCTVFYAADFPTFSSLALYFCAHCAQLGKYCHVDRAACAAGIALPSGDAFDLYLNCKVIQMLYLFGIFVLVEKSSACHHNYCD